MKTKYLQSLLFAGIVFPLFSFAQTTTYRSYFGKEFTHWYSYLRLIDWGPSSEMYSVNNEDTLLNEIRYKKVYRFLSLENLNQWNPHYCFGIREEIETGSLYITTDDISEVLVSRMDLEIGDKYYFPPVRNDFNRPHCEHCFTEVQKDENGYYATVDSIYYKDDRKYIRFDAIYNTMEFDLPLTFIEGIGPNVSFEPLFTYYNIAVCFSCYETETGLWKSDIIFGPGYDSFEDIEECFIEITSIPKIESGFSLQLIQRKGEIELQPDAGDFKSGYVYVYSMQGELLYVQPAKENTNIVIATSGFSKGTYIVRLTEEKTKRSWSSKIIFHHNF